MTNHMPLLQNAQTRDSFLLNSVAGPNANMDKSDIQSRCASRIDRYLLVGSRMILRSVTFSTAARV